jgi:hypothetical protein
MLFDFFLNKKPKVEFYSIVPGLEEVHPPINCRSETDPKWIKNHSSKSKEILKETPNAHVFAVEKCPGIRGLVDYGVYLKNWQDIKVKLLSNDTFEVKTPMEISHLRNGHFCAPEVQSHHWNQFEEFTLARKDTWPTLLKIISNWRVKITKGWSLLLLPCYYTDNPWFSAVPGIFDPSFGSHLNVNIQIHKQIGEEFIINAGTPIVKLIPIQNDSNFYDLEVRKVNQQDLQNEEITNAMLKRRFVSNRKEQKNDLAKIFESNKRTNCPFLKNLFSK